MKRSELYFSVARIPLDFLALLAAFFVAYYLRDTYTLITPDTVGLVSDRIAFSASNQIQPFAHYLHYVWYVVPAMLLVFAASGSYAMRSNAPFWKRFANIVFGVSAGEFVILLLFLLKKDFFLPRSTVLYSWVLGILFVTAVRQVMQLVQVFLRRYGFGVVQLAIVGGSSTADQLMSGLESKTNAYSIAFHTAAGSIDRVIKGLSNQHIDELIVVNEQYDVEDLLRIRNYCLEKHIAFSFVPSFLTSSTESVFAVRHEAGLPMIEVRATPLEGWGRVFKRGFDIIVSLLFIIVLSPVFLVITILQKTTNPGPLVFRHGRIGREQKPIKVTKFRSMRLGWTNEGENLSKNFQHFLDTHPEAAAEWKRDQKLKDDPRISKIGKVLRKTRLDELPQFFDVLSGQLSLVGPRPIIQDEIERFGEKARILFTVRPGITGMWQVEGGGDLPYEERVRLNAYYIENWSPWLDVVIIAKTGWMVIVDLVAKLFGKGRETGGY
jgi:exopolysaccharide biosynthesis polyprenyl glycosylphosphotransferase